VPGTPQEAVILHNVELQALQTASSLYTPLYVLRVGAWPTLHLQSKDLFDPQYKGRCIFFRRRLDLLQRNG
jgi:hypothetical protein